MKAPRFVVNLFVKKVLKSLLDGDKGSTILTLIVAPLVANDINWALVFTGLATQDSALELAKAVGLFAGAVWGIFIGRKKKAPTEPPVS